jgi:hypothetical protein
LQAFSCSKKPKKPKKRGRAFFRDVAFFKFGVFFYWKIPKIPFFLHEIPRAEIEILRVFAVYSTIFKQDKELENYFIDIAMS